MKDIETGEELYQENYIFIANGADERVAMSHETFMSQMDLNKEYNENYSEDIPLSQFYKDHLLCTYEVRDKSENLLSDEKTGTPHQYPIFIPLKGPGFKKTLEHFLNRERIKIN